MRFSQVSSHSGDCGGTMTHAHVHVSMQAVSMQTVTLSSVRVSSCALASFITFKSLLYSLTLQ